MNHDTDFICQWYSQQQTLWRYKYYDTDATGCWTSHTQQHASSQKPRPRFKSPTLVFFFQIDHARRPVISFASHCHFVVCSRWRPQNRPLPSPPPSLSRWQASNFQWWASVRRPWVHPSLQTENHRNQMSRRTNTKKMTTTKT